MGYKYLRHPRTTQELRANQDSRDRLVRGKRRNLPTSYDDLFIHHEKCWKRRRRTKYHLDKTGYAWHEFRYDYWSIPSRNLMRNISSKIDDLGLYYEWTFGGLKWFGPDLTRKYNGPSYVIRYDFECSKTA